MIGNMMLVILRINLVTYKPMVGKSKNHLPLYGYCCYVSPVPILLLIGLRNKSNDSVYAT